MIITYKHGIYVLPHELSKDLNLRVLAPRHYHRWGSFANTRKKNLRALGIEKYQETLKTSKNNSLVPSLHTGMEANTSKKTLEKQKLNFSPGALFRIKTRVSLKYFVNDSSTRDKRRC